MKHRMRMLAAITVTISLIGLAAAACGGEDSTATPTEVPQSTPTPTPIATPTAAGQLAAAMERWEAAGLSEYSFTFQWVCFCTAEYRTPVDIQVKGGVIDTAT